jgi:peptidoglycan/LPS O-acetylase OafA/YrhL
MGRPSIPTLTSLRFFAALLVVIFHYNVGKQLSFLVGVSGFGYEAVTFFFVLSGFILTYAHLEAGEPEKLNLSAAAFMTHRIARIAPAYFIGLAIAAPFFIAGYAVHQQISSSLFVTGMLLVPTALQAWLPSTATLWNIPAWSLSVELFLYVSFAPFVRIVRRTEQIRLLIATYALVCAVAFAGMYLANNRPATDADWWHNLFAYFPLWHLPQFIFGVALGRLFISGKRFSQNTHEVILLASIFVIGVILNYHPVVPMLSSNVILAPVFGVLIFGAAGAIGPFSRILSSGSLVLLGDASYAIYIIHIIPYGCGGTASL